MSKTQKILKFFKTVPGLFTILLFVIIFSFVIFSPKLSSLVFSLRRETVLKEFINETKIHGRVDPQNYWKLREFYSPGHFIFSRDGIAESILMNTLKEIGIDYNSKNVDLTFLFFSSEKLHSLDMLTKQASLSALINQKQIREKDIIFMNKNSLIYKEKQNLIKIVFLMSNSDMQLANGFFDYKDKDKNLIKGQNWFNITSLRTD